MVTWALTTQVDCISGLTRPHSRDTRNIMRSHARDTHISLSLIRLVPHHTAFDDWPRTHHIWLIATDSLRMASLEVLIQFTVCG